MATTAIRPAVFAGKTFLIRQKVLALGKKFVIEDASGAAIAFCKQKVLAWKEDVRLYTDESMTTELMTIKARSVLDFSVAFDVVDSSTGEKVGGLKRKGWKSILKDEWILMDVMDQEIGRIKEDSLLLATLRRFATNLIPQKYVFVFGTHEIGSAKQNFNFFAPKLTLDFGADLNGLLDPRLGVAAGLLLIAVEGRQR
jgi:hypothetical protein